MKTCWKCEKKLKKKEVYHYYNHDFCKKCYEIFDGDAKEEVDKMMNKAEEKKII